MLVSGRALLAATAGICAYPSLGLACQPYWTSISTSPLPSSPSAIRLSAGVAEEGPGIYALGTDRGDIHYWDGDQWIEIPRTGIPLQYPLQDMRFLDEGLGPKLYIQTLLGQYPTAYPFTFRRVNGIWTQLPYFFWGSQAVAEYPGPLASIDFGSGMHVYGVSLGLQAYVMKWAGANWDVIGASGPNVDPNVATSLFPFDSGTGPRLYALGGNFRIGSQVSDFARFDGTTWDLPTPAAGARGYPGRQAVFDWGTGPHMICAGAHFLSSTTNQATISAFDGTNWTEIGSSHSPEGTVTVAGPVCVYDDGRGPALYFAGQFTDMNQVPARGIARWNGTTWEAVPGGLSIAPTPGDNSMIAMNTSRGRALVIASYSNGYALAAAYGAQSQAVMYIGCPTCYANCDLSTTPPTLNIADFLCFLNAFARRDPYANCNNDANFDAADFQCFMNRLAAGCP
jgi:hypothetical protein